MSSKIILTVDVGNTHTVLGVFAKDGRLLNKWRVNTNAQSTSDELIALTKTLFSQCSEDTIQPNCSALASVVLSLESQWQEALRQLCSSEPVIVSGKNNTWIKTEYENPEQIGADRIANAVAAVHKYGTPIIVVDMGTATSFEVIDERGVFTGGIIAPGFESSGLALFERASKIQGIDIRMLFNIEPSPVIGKNTEQAVISGLLNGEAAKIDGLLQMLIHELACEPKIVATGGLSWEISKYCKLASLVDEDLTICGLYLIASKN